jgi:hypothetical protein
MSIREGRERASDNLLRPRFVAEKVWCPLCNDYASLIKSANAAKLASVHRGGRRVCAQNRRQVKFESAAVVC